MADDDLQKEHAANLRAEGHLMRAWNITRNQARQRLHDYRDQQATETARQNAQPADLAKPVPLPPTITSDTTAFPARPFTLGANIPTIPAVTQDRNGWSGLITVCVDDGAGSFTQKTATFSNGLLISVA